MKKNEKRMSENEHGWTNAYILAILTRCKTKRKKKQPIIFIPISHIVQITKWNYFFSIRTNKKRRKEKHEKKKTNKSQTKFYKWIEKAKKSNQRKTSNKICGIVWKFF